MFRREILKFMKKKILPRIFIFLLAVTVISTIAVSSVFAKYVSSKKGTGNNVRPAAFDIEFSGFDVDKISVNFAKDGVPAPPIGYSIDTVEIPFGIKNSADSEVAANVTLKLEFDSDFKEMFKADNSGVGEGISCACRVYVYESESYNELNFVESTATNELGKTVTVWTLDARELPVNSQLQYKLEVDVTYNSYDAVSQVSAYKLRYITDAITVKVDATSVNP